MQPGNDLFDEMINHCKEEVEDHKDALSSGRCEPREYDKTCGKIAAHREMVFYLKELRKKVYGEDE